MIVTLHRPEFSRKGEMYKGKKRDYCDLPVTKVTGFVGKVPQSFLTLLCSCFGLLPPKSYDELHVHCQTKEKYLCLTTPIRSV